MMWVHVQVSRLCAGGSTGAVVMRLIRFDALLLYACSYSHEHRPVLLAGLPKRHAEVVECIRVAWVVCECTLIQGNAL